MIFDLETLCIAKQACLRISADKKSLMVKQIFRISDKSTIGVILFLVSGLFLIIVPFVKESNTLSKIIGFILGLFFVVLSVLSLIRQVTDKIIIRDNIIFIQYNLKRTIFSLNNNLKVKMKTEVREIRRSNSLGSDFIIVSLFLQDQNKEIPILQFQMDNSYSYNAIKLGKELSRIINDKLAPSGVTT